MSVVVITGASGGLGRELATVFGQPKNRILIHYHSGRAQAESIASRLGKQGAQSLVYQADLRDRQSVQGMANAVVKKWEGIDLWINNAGITIDLRVEAIADEQWDEVITTNLHGAFYGIQEAARIMVPLKKGHIINIASLVGQRGNIGQAAYASSKAGLVALTKTAARELGGYNIQVNGVMPGYLSTRMTQELHHRTIEKIAGENVLGRGSEVGEVAQFVYHLSTMKHVSGQIFNLDSRIF